MKSSDGHYNQYNIKVKPKLIIHKEKTMAERKEHFTAFFMGDSARRLFALEPFKRRYLFLQIIINQNKSCNN
jgi:Holliday junction resolvasome RuvABC DNA-binding subunit